MPTFLLDENVHHPDYVIKRCAEKGISVLRVHQLGLNQTDDAIIFRYALEAGHIVVTGNIRDFRSQTIVWLKEGKEYPGALWLQPEKYRNVEAIIRKIIEISQSYETDPAREWWLD